MYSHFLTLKVGAFSAWNVVERIVKAQVFCHNGRADYRDFLSF